MGQRWPQGKNRAAIERALGWPTGALETLRDGGLPAAMPRNPQSPAAIIEYATQHLQIETSPQTLRELRMILDERSLAALPQRVEHLSHESKVKVNVLVTQLEDEEYAALTAKHPDVVKKVNAQFEQGESHDAPPTATAADSPGGRANSSKVERDHDAGTA